MDFYQLPSVHYLNLLLAFHLILDTSVKISSMQALTHFALTMPPLKYVLWAHCGVPEETLWDLETERS